ncbi:GNAT family N-acetyltransferase [Candidatus Cloacimonadota bacterium]
MLKISQTGSIEDILELIEYIPEFEPIHNYSDFESRFFDNNFLILIAYWNDDAVGFKVGYDRFHDGSFYSWLGAVLPEFRRKGIAHNLSLEQEEWAVKNGYKTIKIRTRNKFPKMLQLLIKNGFKIIEFEKKTDLDESRIMLEKQL